MRQEGCPVECSASALWTRYLQFLNRQNAGEAARLFSEDACLDDAVARSLGGCSGRCCGRAEITAFFSAFFAAHRVSATGIVHFGGGQFYDVCLDGAVLLRCAGWISARGDKIGRLEIGLRL